MDFAERGPAATCRQYGHGAPVIAIEFETCDSADRGRLAYSKTAYERETVIASRDQAGVSRDLVHVLAEAPTEGRPDIRVVFEVAQRRRDPLGTPKEVLIGVVDLRHWQDRPLAGQNL